MEFHSNFLDRLFGASKLFGREQQSKAKQYCCQLQFGAIDARHKANPSTTATKLLITKSYTIKTLFQYVFDDLQQRFIDERKKQLSIQFRFTITKNNQLFL